MGGASTVEFGHWTLAKRSAAIGKEWARVSNSRGEGRGEVRVCMSECNLLSVLRMGVLGVAPCSVRTARDLDTL